MFFLSQLIPMWRKQEMEFSQLITMWKKLIFFPFQSGSPPKWPKYMFFEILRHFLTENEKTEATLQIGIDEAHLFHFLSFFHFSKEVLQNGRNVPKNGQNFTFFTPGGQNMQLRNKIHQIKKFPHILYDKMQLFNIIYFFLFSQEVLQNGRNVSKNGQNSTILTPGGQNMQLRNKSHKIKKFPHIL